MTWRRCEDSGRMNVREIASKEGVRTDTSGRNFPEEDEEPSGSRKAKKSSTS